MIWRKQPSAKKAPIQTTGQVAGQVAGQVNEEIIRLLKIIHGKMTRQELQKKISLKGRANFKERYLKSALKQDLIEYTIPDKPNSRLQKYRLTKKGIEYLKKQERDK
ncbi:hypothetical protein AUJ67_08825 [Candidatus Desantisbacteria bacterium CG1_02_49_89]|nr:MAG: hypothetical protein AUJ67_08825 [Candidatus Desantisbacteria bacterium CG1_02_49_89]